MRDVNWLLLVAIFCVPLISCRSTQGLSSNKITEARSLGSLENVYRYSDQIYGGSGPYRIENFQELKRLGIELLISVDGARPKVELAKSFGMRYVHIPIGYDAVPYKAQLQLLKAYQEAEGAIYVHCHHGKHRGPAAIGSMLVGLGLISPEAGVEVLNEVGTSKEYTGLYRDVASARVLSKAEVEQAAPLVSVASVSDFTQAMAAIDVTWDNLKLSRKAAWQVSDKHPDIDPPHEALMLHEHFRELLRADQVNDYSEEEAESLVEFRELLVEAVELSGEFEAGLREQKPIDVIEHRFLSLKQNCKSCHEAYRN